MTMVKTELDAELVDKLKDTLGKAEMVEEKPCEEKPTEEKLVVYSRWRGGWADPGNQEESE